MIEQMEIISTPMNHPKGANSMAASGLVFRSDLVGTRRAISIVFGINGVRNKRSYLVGPQFPELKARFLATAGSVSFPDDFSLSGKVWLRDYDGRLAFLERIN